MRALLIFLALTIPVSPVFPDTPVSPLERLSEAELVALSRTEGPDQLRAKTRLGLIYREQGRLDEAISLLRSAADEYEVLRPYLLLKLAETQAEANRFDEASASAAKLMSESPSSSAAARARMMLPALLARAGKTGEAKKASGSLLRAPLDALTEGAIVETADILAEAGLTDEATSIRKRILLDYTRGRHTEKLYDLLVEMPGEKSPLYSLDFDESVELADDLQSANRHPEAQDWISRVRARFPKRVEDPRLTWVHANTLFRSRQYEELQKLSIPEGAYRHVGLTRLQGHGLWRINRNDEFLEKMQHILDRHSNTSELPTVQVLLGKYYLINGDDETEAAKWLQRAIDGGDLGSSGENLWTLTWIHIKAGRYEKALDVMSDYLRRYPDSSYTSNSLFWSGKLHRKLGNEQKARAIWTRLVDELPYTYYAGRAREILGLSGPSLEVDNGNVWPAEAFRKTLASNSALEVVRELDALGLHEEAIDHFRTEVEVGGDQALAWELANRYADAGEPLRAIGVLNSSFREFVRHGGKGIPRRFWEILYPIDYLEEIRAAAASQNVDPWLMTAIIRQESGWDPTIVSSAGATGLMQIMPAEAEHLGELAGFEQTVTRQMLFDPLINLRVGAAEIRSKLDMMNDDQMLAIASYNGGQDAVRVWLARTPLDDRDLFIDSIPYNETRRYVMAVTRNRAMYELIHGDDGN